MELLQLCQSVTNGINSLSFFVTGGAVAEIVRTLRYREFRGALIALEKVKQNPNSRVGCLKVASRAQFSCPGFGPR